MSETLTPEEREALRRVAGAATQADWIAVTENRRKDSTPLVGLVDRRGQGAHGCIAVFAGAGDLIRDRNANAAHCAAFDPPTALRLLDDLAAVSARLAAVEALADEWEGQQSSGVKIHCARRLRAALNPDPSEAS